MNTIGIDFGTGNTVLAEWYGTQSKIFEQVGHNGLVCSDVAIDKDGQSIRNPYRSCKTYRSTPLKNLLNGNC